MGVAVAACEIEAPEVEVRTVRIWAPPLAETSPPDNGQRKPPCVWRHMKISVRAPLAADQLRSLLTHGPVGAEPLGDRQEELARRQVGAQIPRAASAPPHEDE